MKTHRNQASDYTFDVWVNDQADFPTYIADHDDLGSFDDNWIVSAGDLFGKMDLPTDEPVSYNDEAA
ncbi:hypothetical protein [Spirosoma arcticum]